MSLYPTSVALMSKMLKNLASWLDQADAYAQDRDFPVEVLVQSRLHPDQFPLVRQVQSACDTAKYAASRLSGKEAPSHPDDETTFAELKERVASVLSNLETYSEGEFEGSAEREIVLPFIEGQAITGANYLHEFALPNFFFHVSHAYAILRHNGVPLGKRTFLGSLSLYPKEA